MSADTRAALGRCLCGAVVFEDSFRDERSFAEYCLSGLCQACQDKIFLAPGGAGVHGCRVRTGAIAAHVGPPDEVEELGILPFVFVAENCRFEWEARYIVRVGPIPLEAGECAGLEPLADALQGYRVRVSEFGSFDAAGLDDRLSCFELLVVPDRCSRDAIVEVCPVLADAFPVELAAALPWRELYRRPLVPLEPFARDNHLGAGSPPSAGPASALLRCAILGAVLLLAAERHGRERTVFTHVIESARQSLPDVSRDT